TRRVLPRSQPQGRGRPRAVRRSRPDARPPRVPQPRRPPPADGRAGHAGRDLPPHARRRHGAGAARRPTRAPRRVPGLQPVAGGRLGLRLPGAHLRRAHADARRSRRGAEVGAVGPRPRRPLLRAGPRARDHALGSRVARRPGVRSDVGSAGGVGRGGHRARRQRLLLAVPRRLGRGHRDGGVPPEPVPFDRVVERGAGLVRQPPRPRSVPALPQPAHGVDRDRLRLGLPPLRQAEEVVLADAAGLPGGPARDLQAPRLGVALLRGRARLAARHHRRRSHADGLRLPPRRGPGRAELVHQGPGELRLHARGLAPGDARQRCGVVAAPPRVTTLSWPSEAVPESVLTALSGPGAPFELREEEVLGAPMLVFAQRPRTLVELLRGAAERMGDRPYVIFPDRQYTFASILQPIAAVAAALRDEYGVGPGDRVAIVAPNTVEYALTFWATTALGAITVGLNGWWTGEEIAYAVELTEPKLLLGDRRRLERLEGVALPKGLPVLEFERDFASLEAYAPDAELPDVAIDEDDPFVILFTSGTTGRPKGVMLSHRSNIHFMMA